MNTQADTGMVKLMFSDQVPEAVEAGVRMMEDSPALRKQASVTFDCSSDELKPDKNHVGLHLVALGDFEHYGFNRNFDSFPKKACAERHGTFVSHGAVFEHHKNRDRDKNMGTIVKSAYNEPMGRIELFIHAHRDKAAEHLDRLEKTGEVSVSMACKVPYDICSICENKRKSSSDPKQCSHIRDEFGKVAADGTVTGTHNDKPTWFDISFVGRPADRIAWNLKTASAAGAANSSVIAAEASGIWVPDDLQVDIPHYSEKLAMLKKLSAREAAYLRVAESGAKTAEDRYYSELLKSAVCSIPDAAIDLLRSEKPDDVLRKLAACGVVMDVDSFFKYAFGADYGDVADAMPAIRRDVNGPLFTRLYKSGAYQKVCRNNYFDVDTDDTLLYGLNRLRCEEGVKIASSICSFDRESVRNRIVDSTVQGMRPLVKSGSGVDSEAPSGGACVYAAYKLSALRSVSGCGEDSDRNVALAIAQNMVNK